MTYGNDYPSKRCGGALVCNDTIVFGMGGGGVNRSAETAVLTDEIVFRDPTGTAAEASNRNPDIL
jgi:hypothetical protein